MTTNLLVLHTNVVHRQSQQSGCDQIKTSPNFFIIHASLNLNLILLFDTIIITFTLCTWLIQLRTDITNYLSSNLSFLSFIASKNWSKWEDGP